MVNIIGIIGLGYVGAPLALYFAEKYLVIGFDINKTRVDELNSFIDHTLEIDPEKLKEVISLYDESQGKKGLIITSLKNDLRQCNIYIVTVPTPVDKHNMPDLTPLEKASEIVGEVIKTNDIVIYESTVYPGVTEEFCVPIIERVSGLAYNHDFTVGYSPERINPGDKEHTLLNTTKIVSGSTPQTLKRINELYSSIIKGGTHQAPSIKVAETAKVVENIQRDVNIALMNELSKVCGVLDIDTKEVLEAAGTKWNFLHFTPGFVGGHCISVDPYYLIYKSKINGYLPRLIMKSRELNANMPFYVVKRIFKLMNRKGIIVKDAKFLILGYTFKENCPDTRNTKVDRLYKELSIYSKNVDVYDPWINETTQIPILENLIPGNLYDVIILAVNHTCFKDIPVKNLLTKQGIIFDIKGFYPKDIVDERL